MTKSYRIPKKDLIVSAFFGGMALSILELASALKSKENILDIYFIAGMAMAGIIGVFGVFLSQANDVGGAITSGIAAPQLLGGFVKVGTSTAGTVAAIIFPIITPAYADIDSLVIAANVNGPKTIQIRDIDGNVLSDIGEDTIYFKIKKIDSLVIVGTSVAPKTIFVPSRDTVRISVGVELIEKQKRSSRVMRGLFASKFDDIISENEKMNVEIK